MNKLYDHGRNAFARGDLHWKVGGDTFKCTLIDTNYYDFDQDNDQYMNLDTVDAQARTAVATLTVLNPSEGICDAEDLTFPLVSGNVSEGLIIWKDGGGGGVTQSGTTDLLVAWFDVVAGLPVTPNGGNIKVSWDDGASKIFKL